MNRRLLGSGLALLCLILLSAAPASAATCATAWSCSTAYGLGATASFNGHNYTLCPQCSRAATCPGFDPSADNWWSDAGACTTGATPTSTATATATTRATATATTRATATATTRATATSTATATATTRATATATTRATATSTATATTRATATSTPRPTATSTATPTQGGTGTCWPAWSCSTSYGIAAQASFNGVNYQLCPTCSRAPNCPGFDPSADNWWIAKGSCSGGGATPTATAGGTPTATPTTPPTPTSCGSNCPAHAHQLVGYWHNWDSGGLILRLKDVNPNWDIVVVAFADNAGDSFTFTPAAASMTAADMSSDIAFLHSRGQKVIVSGGGALNTPSIASASTCSSSIVAMMDKYGFDGFDVDFENGGVFLNSTDTNVNAPTTANIVNLATCLTSVKSSRANAILTLAPIANYVTAGYQYYGPNTGASNWNGAYLPVYAKAAAAVSYVWPQYYNEANITLLDGAFHSQGGIDNLVGSSDMLIRGFGVQSSGGRAELSHFNGIPQQKIYMGVPASTSAAPGYLTNSSLETAFTALKSGGAVSGYSVTGRVAFPSIGGYMTWSINWDILNGGLMQTQLGPWLHTQ